MWRFNLICCLLVICCSCRKGTTSPQYELVVTPSNTMNLSTLAFRSDWLPTKTVIQPVEGITKLILSGTFGSNIQVKIAIILPSPVVTGNFGGNFTLLYDGISTADSCQVSISSAINNEISGSYLTLNSLDYVYFIGGAWGQLSKIAIR